MSLSLRELQIIQGAAMGLTNEEIGKRLYLSGFTVKSHLGRIAEKTGVRARAGLVGLAFRQGWLAWEGEELVIVHPGATP